MTWRDPEDDPPGTHIFPFASRLGSVWMFTEPLFRSRADRAFAAKDIADGSTGLRLVCPLLLRPEKPKP